MIASEATIQVTNISQNRRQIGGTVLEPGVTRTVPLEYATLYGGTRDLYFDYSPFREQLRSRTQDGRPSFDFHFPLSSLDGYGRHAASIWRGLQGIGCDVSVRGSDFLDDDMLDADVRSAYFSCRNLPPARVGLAMSVPYDTGIWRHQSIYKLVISQFETDHVPEKYVEEISKCDHLIVTSHFQPDVWKRSGLKLPISVLTPGVDTDFFSSIERPPSDTFNVLILGALTERKNPLGAIRIFQEASRGDKAWRFTIKTRALRGDGIERIRKAIAGDPRIKLVATSAPGGGVRQLYHDHHCLLWPSKGEGVGLPPLEAMSTGMELVCADNSGMRDYLSEDHAYLIPTARMQPASGPGRFEYSWVARFGDVGSWWVPDEKKAVKQLRKAFENWARGKGKGQRAARYVRAHHTLRHQALSVLAVVQEYL